MWPPLRMGRRHHHWRFVNGIDLPEQCRNRSGGHLRVVEETDFCLAAELQLHPGAGSVANCIADPLWSRGHSFRVNALRKWLTRLCGHTTERKSKHKNK